jgi:hypothetical protein
VRSGSPPARSCSRGKRSSPGRVIGSLPTAVGCRWSGWTSRTYSRAPTGRLTCSTCSRPAATACPETGAPWTESRRGDWPGISAFLRIGGEVDHTYSTFGRGIDLVGGPPGLPGHYLDLTALGRQEEWEEPKGRATPLGCRPVAPNLRLPTNTTAVPEPSGRELRATTWRVAGLGAVIAGRRTYDTSLPWWGADGPTGPRPGVRPVP